MLKIIYYFARAIPFPLSAVPVSSLSSLPCVGHESRRGLKRILILGATGSIGTSACDVVRTHPSDFCIAGLAVRSNRERAEALGREFGAPVFCGEDAAERAVAETDADLVLVSTVGLSGLAPTLAAIEKGIDVALATKEVMVAAGELVCARAEAKGLRLRACPTAWALRQPMRRACSP